MKQGRRSLTWLSSFPMVRAERRHILPSFGSRASSIIVGLTPGPSVRAAQRRNWERRCLATHSSCEKRSTEAAGYNSRSAQSLPEPASRRVLNPPSAQEFPRKGVAAREPATVSRERNPLNQGIAQVANCDCLLSIARLSLPSQRTLRSGASCEVVLQSTDEPSKPRTS